MTVELGTVDYAERRRLGLDLYRQIMAKDHPYPDSPRSAALIDFVYAEIWSRPGLTRRERRLITLSCLAGADAHDSFADHVYAAVRSGDLNADELGEFVLHFAVYCGWGKAETIERIVGQQVARGYTDKGERVPEQRPEPLTAVAADQESRKQGGEEEFRVVNVAASPPRNVPYYDNGILNFVFGDMWKRPGLSRRDRRWITLACVGLDDTIVPVRSHVYSAMKTGDISFEEMREMVLQFAAYSGWPKASFMQQAVDESHQRIQDEASAARTSP